MMRLREMWNPSERLARLTWWWILRLRRLGFAKNINYKIASRLSSEHATRFIARGKVQNAFARRHAVTVIKFFINVALLIFLWMALHIAAEWLFAHGYFTAPGSPKRELNPGD